MTEQFDAPWKVAVERFLEPLLQLCFPAVHAAIDWRQPPEFLDTELPQLGPEHEQGGRTVDKLVKVRRLDGQDQWLFIHIEVQAQPEAQFPRRMWVYYYRLCDKHGPGVVSLAILADADPAWRPHTYATEIVGCRLRFEFPLFKVLEFTGAEAIWERTGNPFALVLAAHQLALGTKRDPLGRYEGRFRLIRHLRRHGLERKDLADLWRVIHVLTRLPRDLELRFKAELATLPPSEGFMTTTKLITPWEEIALEEGYAKGQVEGLAKGRVEGRVEGLAKGRVEGRVEGLAKGRVEGRVEGLAEGLLDALETRFGSVPESVRSQLEEARDESRLRQAMRLAVTEPTLDQFLAKF